MWVGFKDSYADFNQRNDALIAHPTLFHLCPFVAQNTSLSASWIDRGPPI